MVFVASKVEGLPGDEVVEGVVVESGDVGGLPYLFEEGLTHLVFENVAVGAVEETQDLLLLGSGDTLELDSAESVLNGLVQKVPLLHFHLQHPDQVLRYEVFLSFVHVGQLFKVSQIHGFMGSLKLDHLNDLIEAHFSHKAGHVQQPINHQRHLLLLLKSHVWFSFGESH